MKIVCANNICRYVAYKGLKHVRYMVYLEPASSTKKPWKVTIWENVIRGDTCISGFPFTSGRYALLEQAKAAAERAGDRCKVPVVYFGKHGLKPKEVLRTDKGEWAWR
jgi:hypothetical protein